MAIKNFWSLQAGEAIISDLIKKKLSKCYQIFFPVNNQLKNLDLILINLKTKKIVTIQIKESREFNEGTGNGWFIVNRDKVKNKVVDFYIFVVYATIQTAHKIKIQVRTLIIPSEDLMLKSKNKRLISNKNYYYFFRIQGNKAYDDREKGKEPEDYSEYVDNFKLLEI